MPLQKKTDGLFMAGESLDQVWRDFCHQKDDLPGNTRMMFPSYGIRCAAQGCHYCTNTDCLYADFIRNYRDYPRCD